MDTEQKIQEILQVQGAVLERDKKREVWRLPNGKQFVRSKTAIRTRRLVLNELSTLRRLVGDPIGGGQAFQEEHKAQFQIPAGWMQPSEPEEDDSEDGRLRMVCPNYVVEHMTITPELASSFLELNVGNRALSDSKLEEYIADMNADRWWDNGDAIRFSRDNVLIDGQKRLTAIVMSGKPQQALVVTDIDPAARHSIDIGQKRTVSNMLQIEGMPYANRSPAAARMVLCFEKGDCTFKGLSLKMSNLAVKEYVKEHQQELADALHAAAPAIRTFGKAPALGAAAVILARIDKLRAAEFLDGLGTGDRLSSNSPIFQLRSRLYADSSARAQMPRGDVMALIFKAWNLWTTGRTCKVLSWKAEVEEFPLPINAFSSCTNSAVCA